MTNPLKFVDDSAIDEGKVSDDETEDEDASDVDDNGNVKDLIADEIEYDDNYSGSESESGYFRDEKPNHDNSYELTAEPVASTPKRPRNNLERPQFDADAHVKKKQKTNDYNAGLLFPSLLPKSRQCFDKILTTIPEARDAGSRIEQMVVVYRQCLFPSQYASPLCAPGKIPQEFTENIQMLRSNHALQNDSPLMDRSLFDNLDLSVTGRTVPYLRGLSPSCFSTLLSSSPVEVMVGVKRFVDIMHTLSLVNFECHLTCTDNTLAYVGLLSDGDSCVGFDETFFNYLDSQLQSAREMCTSLTSSPDPMELLTVFRKQQQALHSRDVLRNKAGVSDDVLENPGAHVPLLDGFYIPQAVASFDFARRLRITDITKFQNSMVLLITNLENWHQMNLQRRNLGVVLKNSMSGGRLYRDQMKQHNVPLVVQEALELELGFGEVLGDVRSVLQNLLEDIVILFRREKQDLMSKARFVVEFSRLDAPQLARSLAGSKNSEDPDVKETDLFFSNQRILHPAAIQLLESNDRIVDVVAVSKFKPIMLVPEIEQANLNGTAITPFVRPTPVITGMVRRVLGVITNMGFARVGNRIMQSSCFRKFVFQGKVVFFEEPSESPFVREFCKYKQPDETSMEAEIRGVDKSIPLGGSAYSTDGWVGVGNLEDLVAAVHTSSTISGGSQGKAFDDFTSTATNVASAGKALEKLKDQGLPELERDRFRRSFCDGVLDFNVNVHTNTLPSNVVQVFNTPALWKLTHTNSKASVHSYNSRISKRSIGDNERQWHTIRADHYRHLVRHQIKSTLVRFYFYAMHGRLFFPLNHLDHYEKLATVIGIAHSGKSTDGDIVMNYFSGDDVATISPNIEKQFGLQACLGKLLCVVLEMTSSMALDRGELQSMATGEPMTIAVKGLAPVSIVWDIPTMLYGNQLIGCTDTSGSILRRFFTWFFNRRVTNVNTRLGDILREEFGEIALLNFYAYMALLDRVGNEELCGDRTCPEYFNKVTLKLASSTSPIVSRLMDTNNFIIADGLSSTNKELTQELLASHRQRIGNAPVDTSRTSTLDLYSGSNLGYAVHALCLDTGKNRHGTDCVYGIAPASVAIRYQIASSLQLETIVRTADTNLKRNVDPSAAVENKEIEGSIVKSEYLITRIMSRRKALIGDLKRLLACRKNDLDLHSVSDLVLLKDIPFSGVDSWEGSQESKEKEQDEIEEISADCPANIDLTNLISSELRNLNAFICSSTLTDEQLFLRLTTLVFAPEVKQDLIRKRENTRNEKTTRVQVEEKTFHDKPALDPSEIHDSVSPQDGFFSSLAAERKRQGLYQLGALVETQPLPDSILEEFPVIQEFERLCLMPSIEETRAVHAKQKKKMKMMMGR